MFQSCELVVEVLLHDSLTRNATNVQRQLHNA
jgi:hypothetical protein